MVFQGLLGIGGGLGAERLRALGGGADRVGEGFQVQLGVGGEAVESGDRAIDPGLEGFMSEFGGLIGGGLGSLGGGRHDDLLAGVGRARQRAAALVLLQCGIWPRPVGASTIFCALHKRLPRENG